MRVCKTLASRFPSGLCTSCPIPSQENVGAKLTFTALIFLPRSKILQPGNYLWEEVTLYTHIILNNLWLKNLCISLLLGGSHSPDTPEQRWPWGSPQAQRPRASCHAAQKALLLEGKPRNRNLEVNSTESFQAGAVSQGS